MIRRYLSKNVSFSKDMIENAIKALHQHPAHGYLCITGGGASGLSKLLAEPGASSTILGADIPYSSTMLSSQLGGTLSSACSEDTAAMMAAYAFERARRFSEKSEKPIFGLACTAALATGRTRRGENRAFIAIQTNADCFLRGIYFDDVTLRTDQETALGDLLVQALTQLFNLPQAEPSTKGIRVTDNKVTAPAEWQRLMSGELKMFSTSPSIKAVFPGAFNPLHQGHKAIARVAQKRLGHPVHFEVSVTNVDKPALSYWHLERRIQGLKTVGPYVFTSAPTFREKATLFPNACFLVGADTILRIDNDRYYASPSDRLAAIDYITSQNCRFLVFGRMIDGSFNTLSDLSLSPQLDQLCDEVTASEFREDIASSDLRARPEA